MSTTCISIVFQVSKSYLNVLTHRKTPIY